MSLQGEGVRVIVRQPLQIATILEQAPKLAQEWAAERQVRQQRTQADPADYERLRQLGVHLMAVPVEIGGTPWYVIHRSQGLRSNHESAGCARAYAAFAAILCCASGVRGSLPSGGSTINDVLRFEVILPRSHQTEL